MLEQLSSFSRLSGIAATFLLAVTFILGRKSKLLDKWFGGLPRVYRIHHYLALLTLAVIFVHIFLSIASLLDIDTKEAFAYLVDFSDPIVTSGWLSVFGIVAIIALAYLRKKQHAQWISIHRISLILSVLVVSHGLLASQGRIISAKNTPLLLSFFFLIFGVLIHLIKTRGDRLIVSKVTTLSAGISELTLQAVDSIVYQAGQFGYFSFDCQKDCGVSNEFHPFSVTRAAPQELEIIVKNLGDDTRKIQCMKPDTPARVWGPFGQMPELIERSNMWLWIAGGIGVTPFIGMLRTMERTKKIESKNVSLIYAVQKQCDAVYLDELNRIQDSHPNFSYHLVEGQTAPSLEVLSKYVSDWKNRTILLSGPRKMIAALRSNLRRHAKPMPKIYDEGFDYL